MGQDSQVAKQRTEHAREELATDLHALTEKLNVKKQVDRKRSEVVDNVKEKLGMQSHGQSNSEVGAVASSVKSHPLAVLALGYGATTLFKSWKSKHERHVHGTTTTNAMALPPYAGESSGGSRLDGAKSTVTDAASSAKETVSSKVDDLKGTASNAKASAGEKLGDAKDRAGEVGTAVAERAHDVKGTVTRVAPTSKPELERMVRDNLPAFGIGALAAGAIAGLLAPRTKLEDERIGERLHEAREQLVDTVQEKAVEAKEAMQHGLEEGVSTVKDTAKSDLGMGDSQDSEPVKGADVSGDPGDDLLIKPLAGMSAGGAGGVEEKRPGRITGSKGLGGSTDSIDAPTPVGSDRTLP